MERIKIISLILKKNYNPQKFFEIIKNGKIEEIIERELLKKAEEIEKECKRKGFWIKLIIDKDYPEELLNTPNPPIVLFGFGNENLRGFKFGIVGTRKPTDYGRKNARIFARELSLNGICIISGGARGIDTEVHREVVEIKGKTICVLGSGFKFLYPPENKRLFSKIVENGGTILTEFPPETPPYKYNFPFRNRIIAALSKGILVIEASMQSGTFSTCEWALSYGKEVFALPGPVDSKQSEGTNYLIKEGAHCVTSPEDILSFFGIKKERREIILTDEEKEIIEILNTPKYVEEIVEITNKPISFIYNIIFSLQMKKLIEKLPGNKYVSLLMKKEQF
jgi:DNA processing protein